MKFNLLIVSTALLVSGSGAALAQYVKGNEAVKLLADGSKRVETPPLPATGRITRSKPPLRAPK